MVKREGVEGNKVEGVEGIREEVIVGEGGLGGDMKKVWGRYF